MSNPRYTKGDPVRSKHRKRDLRKAFKIIMRIVKKDPRHWYYLIHSGINVWLSSPFRVLKKKRSKRRIVFYDQMNGNAKALAEYLIKNAPDEYEMFFLAFPPNQAMYSQEYSRVPKQIKRLSPLKLRDMIEVAKTDFIITNYGVETLVYYQWLTDIVFINLWHGMGYRDHQPEDFVLFKGYYAAWVTSPNAKKLYARWGWAKDKIKVTGYARVDKLVTGDFSTVELRRKYGIEDKFRKVILVAPTWAQYDNSYNTLPFNSTLEEFVDVLDEAGKACDSLVILRPHLESGDLDSVSDRSNVKIMPGCKYPCVEEILCMSDILVSDWSSILADYLVLRRPTIFMEVPSCYKELTVLQECRYGEKVHSLRELAKAICKYAKNPKPYARKHAKSIALAEKLMWGSTLDGKSTERYYKELRRIAKERRMP